MLTPQQFRSILMWAAYWLMWLSALTLLLSIWLGANWRLWLAAGLGMPVFYMIREATHDMWMDVKAPRIPATFTSQRSDPDWEEE